jgi:hypothetical protein
MSHKKKSGLQRGLSDIVAKQTAPAPDKSELSRGLIDKFAEVKERSEGSTMSTLGTHGTQSSVAPMRDFHKVPNSISRNAVPAGVFKGKCKQLYDFLYLKTRGAIVPTRSIKLTRKQIMDGAGIGSTKTLFLNLRHLRENALITWDECGGTHNGNEYFVSVPEEIQTRGTLRTLSTQGTQSAPSPILPRVPMVETTQSTQCSSLIDTTRSGDLKTLIKDKEIKTDDEAFAEMVNSLRQVVKELTGKEPNNSDSARWRELSDVLIAELRIAAGRTTISSVPAFLAEHLRRRLWKLDKKQAQAEGRELPDQTLTAAPSSQAVDCPDCCGSGWWYPNGPEKGVAKCKHAARTAVVESPPAI